MHALRWTLLVLTAALVLGWLTLIVVAGRFRRSFGASPRALAANLLTAALVILLAALAFPGERWLLHVAAAVAAGLIGMAVVIRRRAPNLAMLIVGYASAWLAFYWLAMRD